MSQTKPGGLLIACALKKETFTLKALLGERSENNKPIAYAVTGVGAARTEARLSELLRTARPDILIFTGTAGQLKPSVAVGQVISPEIWQMEQGTAHRVSARLAEEVRQGELPVCGKGLTVGRPVLRAQRRSELWRETGACICDMEAAGALQVAVSLGVPCLAPKVVSDTGDFSPFAFWSSLDGNLALLGAYLRKLMKAIRY
jgi:nucleoside phosphorylase